MVSKFIKALIWLCLLFPARLLADPFDLAPPSAEISGLAGCVAARDIGSPATYYNPAALGRLNDYSTIAGYAIWSPRLHDRVIAYGSLGNMENLRGTDPAATRNVVDQAFRKATNINRIGNIYFAQSIPLKRIFTGLDRGITIGILVSLPGSGFSVVNLAGQSPDTPQWPYFGPNDQRMMVAASIGVEAVKKHLFVGAGAMILADISGMTLSSTPIALFDPKHPDNPPPPAASTAVFHQNLSLDVAPVIGILYRTSRWADVALTYHGEMSLDLDFDAKARLDMNLGTPMDATLPYNLKSSFFYLPRRVTAAAVFHPVTGLDISVDVTYAFTRDYKDHLPITVFTLDKSVVGPNGELKNLQSFGHLRAVYKPLPKVRTRDTVIPRVGITYAFKRIGLRLMSGYAYLPSPISPAQGYNNLLLSAGLHQAGLGVGYKWGLGNRSSITLDGALNIGVFNTRYNEVGNGDDARGVVKTSGWTIGGGVSLKTRY